MSAEPGGDFVDLRHVTVMRGAQPVLHDITLHIPAGESVAIVGPNGCGKSTLLRTLTCELYPLAQSQTSVTLFGRARWDVTELRRAMGVVTSDAPAADALDVPGLDIVLSGFFSAARLWPHLAVTPAMLERAKQAMADVGVTSLGERPLRAMSSGQQKRLMLARALACSGQGTQRVLLLDEPSTMLDIAAQRDLRRTVQRLAEQGTGILLVMHHIEDLVPAIRRVLLMQHGRIVADGLTADLLTTGSMIALFETDVEVTRRDGMFYAR